MAIVETSLCGLIGQEAVNLLNERISSGFQSASTIKRQLLKLAGNGCSVLTPVVPQTFEEATQHYGYETIDCQPCEWDNRTTPENAVWLITRLQYHAKELEAEVAQWEGDSQVECPKCEGKSYYPDSVCICCNGAVSIQHGYAWLLDEIKKLRRALSVFHAELDKARQKSELLQGELSFMKLQSTPSPHEPDKTGDD